MAPKKKQETPVPVATSPPSSPEKDSSSEYESEKSTTASITEDDESNDEIDDESDSSSYESVKEYDFTTSIICGEPCSSILNYTIDQKTKELLKKCTTCQRIYRVPESDYIITTRFHHQAGEEGSNEAINFHRIAENITIKSVYYDCKKCKKQTVAKTWRDDHTLNANFLCLQCKNHFH